ncbi:MAG: HAD family hydrolase [Armatimonadota bacterium]|nr:HAD family hydrolase [bacterium]
MDSITTSRESDYKRWVDDFESGKFLPGTGIEIIREPAGRGTYAYALFDFDGTLSLLREGWPSVMGPMMVEELLKTPDCEPEDDLRTHVDDLISQTTGKQTIYQMMDFCEEIRHRGGQPLEATAYKKKYLDLLMERIKDRLEGLRCGRTRPEEMLVPGTYELLDALKERGVRMYLASGTDEPSVQEEAELLGVTPYFGEHIYGAIEDYRNYSKAQVIERILAESGVSGSKMLGFGDGYVELDNTKAAGGTAIGVATDEQDRSGKPDPFKRDRLIGVGADVIVPDFTEASTLVSYLFGEMS